MNIQINQALYGPADVTNIVQEAVDQNRLSFPCSNELFGDPTPGTIKEFVCQYSVNGNHYSISKLEGDLIDFYTFERDVRIFNGESGLGVTVLELYWSNRADDFVDQQKKAKHIKHDLIDCAMYARENTENLIYGSLTDLYRGRSMLGQLDLVYLNLNICDPDYHFLFSDLVLGYELVSPGGLFYVDATHAYRLKLQDRLQAELAVFEHYLGIRQSAIPFSYRK